MASHPSVHFDHKALSAIERRIPSLIILLKINRNERRTTRLLGMVMYDNEFQTKENKT